MKVCAVKGTAYPFGGGGTEYTAGPGIVIDDGEIREKVPVDVLNKTDYDALPEDQKNNGVYFIPDGSGDAGGGETACEEIYSTDERRIGTWIDGKPLYRKVIQATSPSSTSTNSQFITSLGYSVNLTECSGIIKQSSGNQIPLPAVYGTNSYASLPHVDSNGGVYMMVNHDNYKNRPVTIVLKYTKPTDSAQEASE